MPIGVITFCIFQASKTRGISKDKTNVDDFFEAGTDAEKSRFVA